jgi:hypothetical protein
MNGQRFIFMAGSDVIELQIQCGSKVYKVAAGL